MSTCRRCRGDGPGSAGISGCCGSAGSCPGSQVSTGACIGAATTSRPHVSGSAGHDPAEHQRCPLRVQPGLKLTLSLLKESCCCCCTLVKHETSRDLEKSTHQVLRGVEWNLPVQIIGQVTSPTLVYCRCKHTTHCNQWHAAPLNHNSA